MIGKAAMLYKIVCKVWNITKWIAGLIIAVLIGYAANLGVLQVKDIPSSFYVSFVNSVFLSGIHQPLTLSLIVLLGIFIILTGVIVARGKHAEENKNRSDTITEERALSLEVQNRLRLIAKVRTFWITGVLEQSLYGMARIELELREQSNAVDNPWRLVFQETNRPARLLPSDTSIT